MSQEPDDGRAALHVEVLEALRGYAVAYQESTLHFARSVGLPTTDGVALGEVVYADLTGAPLSPAGLSRRTGLTSGAVNALVNLLAQHGLLTRTREHDDRRIVSLRPTAEALERAQAYYGTRAEELQDALASYDHEELRRVRDFLVRFAAILPRAD
ncbi:MarR family winged helix-turn-helix transcriptional regulator [Nocardioides sp. CFH 31398]|uniref:MarR family winged helix-turn-helix transcriptional regulator n=1 Tax=Nocardioides sp. CFH 31398 TaxID=2919579 RepID=UPI001F064002|nr:MarR family transcriptional regulator [Nocardioides sp. CFH 31398]MCH1868180.1 MarR family transcriptional regulator [Nocardioides sp. CFH 31398]